MREEELATLAELEWLNAVEYREQTGSTNDLALREPLSSGDGWGWLFVAERQTAGRGRRGNAWWAGAGALTFSLAVDCRRLGLKAERWPLVPLAAGLAVHGEVASAVASAGVTVKWPNDVYLNARKVAGVLVEQREGESQLVIGIGINVNADLREAPAELVSSAIAMNRVSGEDHDLGELLAGVLGRLAGLLERLEQEPADLVARLNEVSFLTGRRVRLDLEEGCVWGECRGIADNGGLRLATANGLQTYLGGTVGAVE